MNEPSRTTTPQHPSLVLRNRMQRGCVGLPGAFNGLVAKAVARAGFGGCYVSGAAVSASMGMPDVGMVSLTEFCFIIEQVARASGLPVIADADTGFGESEMVMRTVFEYHRAGAAGLHIEDQVFPKRCGHLDGKALVPCEHMVEKVRAAAAARDRLSGHISVPSTASSGAGFQPASPSSSASRSTGIPPVSPSGGGGGGERGSFIICARTDARGVEGFDSAVQRARDYVNAGADMIFPEGLTSEEEFAKFAAALRDSHPACFLLANMTEFGKTPIIPLSRFAELGYHAVIWPVTTLRAAMGEVSRILSDLSRDGHVGAFVGRVQDRKALYDLLGYTPGTEWQWPGELRG